jgi:hypothetical protein
VSISVIGVIINQMGVPVSWRSKAQIVVTLSSIEAAISEAVTHA